jgi:hypothetical protein
MWKITSLALMASLLFLPDPVSADKKGKGPKHHWKQQEKWEKDQQKREDKYWKDVEKARREDWKRYGPWHYEVPPYAPRLEGQGFVGPYRIEIWR